MELETKICVPYSAEKEVGNPKPPACWRRKETYRIVIAFPKLYERISICTSNLHWKLFSIYQVFRSWSSMFAPVQVELKCLVRYWQISSTDLYMGGQIKLN